MRIAAFWHSQEGRDWDRIRELEVFGQCLNDSEEAELDELRRVYPRDPSESSLAKEIAVKRAELRQRAK